MANRCLWLALGLIGAATALVFLLLGPGLGRRPLIGAVPLWARRLLWAGVVLLAALGWLAAGGPVKSAPPEGERTCPDPDPDELRLREIEGQLQSVKAPWSWELEEERGILASAEALSAALPEAAPADWMSRDDLEFSFSRRDTIRVNAWPTIQDLGKSQRREKLDRAIARARDRLYEHTGELGDSAEWRMIARAWHAARLWAGVDTALLPGGRLDERRGADYLLCRAWESIDRLQERGALLPAEAGLLRDEAGRLRTNIFEHAPDDLRITCYLPVIVNPLSKSAERLRQRAELLRELNLQRKVARAVLEKMTEAIRADLDLLRTGAGQIGGSGLERPQPAAPQEPWREVTVLLEQIEDRLQESATY